MTSSFFISFSSPSGWFSFRLCFDLKEIMFYCKENEEAAFPQKKKSGDQHPREENDLL